MADDEEKQPEENAEPSTPGAARKWLARLTGRLSLGVLLGISIGLHVLGVWYFRDQSTEAPPSGEVTIGKFEFHDRGSPATAIAAASFRLHVGLLEAIEDRGRTAIDQRRFRVQESVEQLLREAHGADFEDAGLPELKRALQERINRVLGFRAVEDVIVTDLAIERREQPAIETATSESTPDNSSS